MVERDRNRQQGSRRRRFPGDESPHLSGERTADRAGLSIYVLLASLEMGDRGTRHGEKTFRTKKFLKHEDGAEQNTCRILDRTPYHTTVSSDPSVRWIMAGKKDHEQTKRKSSSAPHAKRKHARYVHVGPRGQSVVCFSMHVSQIHAFSAVWKPACLSRSPRSPRSPRLPLALTLGDAPPSRAVTGRLAQPTPTCHRRRRSRNSRKRS